MKRKFLFFWIALVILVSGVMYGFNYKKTDKLNTCKAVTAVSMDIKNCPKKGQTDCPQLHNCPLKSTVDCPLTGGTPSCCVKK